MAVLAFAASFLIALTGAGPDGQTSNTQLAVPIRVLESSHEIDFPREVRLALEAESSSEITQIRLFYSVGGRPARVYGYPKFTPSTRVAAEFIIDTDGSSYIPSGVDIEYYYIIQDSNNNSVETDRYTFEYLDPQYDWKRYTSNGLTVLWHNRSEETVIKTVEEVHERLVPARQLLGLSGSSPPLFKAVIVNGRREAARSFPAVSGAATRDHIYGGFAFGELGVFVLQGLSTSGMTHELMHLLVDEALDSPRTKVPAWLNEGLAMYYEGNGGRRNATLSRSARNGQLLPLRGMGSVPGRPNDVGLFYAQSQNIVRYMMDELGTENMASLLDRLDDGDRINEAIPAVYDMSLNDLDTQWRRQFVEGVSLAPPVDPGQLANSLLIAGAVAVAIVSVIIRWLRQLGSNSNADDIDA